jgi:hypothetical protein
MGKDLAYYESVPAEKLRDRVMDDLVKHYALERFDLEEFEARTDRVSKAATRSELIAQIADLPPLEGEERSERLHGPAADRAATSGCSTYSDPKESDFAIAIFGGSDLRGAWRAPRKLSSLCLFGGINIDLRKASIPEGGLAISCACAFGGIDIVVPPGVRLEVRGFGVFGSFDRPHNYVDDPRAPTVVVEGLALFGGVSIKVKP